MKLSIRNRSSGFPSGRRAFAPAYSDAALKLAGARRRALIRSAVVALVIPLLVAGPGQAEVMKTAIITASFSAAASSQLLQRPGESVISNEGWNAVGRLKLGDSGFCTAVLISPKEILTSAHCLYNKKSGTRIDATRLMFQAGWQNGAAFAERRVAFGVVHPAYTFNKSNELANIAHDLALLELDEPIELPAARLTPGQLPALHLPAIKAQGLRNFLPANAVEAGDKVGVASYAYNRAQRLSVQKSCPVLARKQGVMVTSCSIDAGSSGAPVFVSGDGEGENVLGVVSIIAAKAKLNGKPVALATPIMPNLPILRSEMAKERGRDMLSAIAPEPAEAALS